MEYTCEEIAKMIDHSLLKPELTEDDIKEGCEIAKKYNVAAVCCVPTDVTMVKEYLKGTNIQIDAVVGFPHGYNKTETKVFEAEQAIKDGATELDMVIHIGKLRSGNFEYVKNDIKAVTDLAHKHGVTVKVILENCYLTDELKKIGCKLAEEAGADFVKTSTGFAKGGATIEDLKLMLKSVSPKVKVKAAGGVRDFDKALEVKELGVARFGATQTVKIMEECYKRRSTK